MRSLRAFIMVTALLCVPSAFAAACNCGNSDSASTSTGVPATGAGGAGGKNGVGGADGNLFTNDAGQCLTATDCDGGVCVNGVCCDSAANICAGACCGKGTVCLFNLCVTPGNDCHTANDCGPGRYCETALGSEGDAGVSGAGDAGGACTQPLPLEGKCLNLPPICDSAAGAPGLDASCVSLCEYHPSAGQLHAAPKWTWGPVAQKEPDFTDVWSTPTVGRVYDGNCDGKVDSLDSPNVIFVSGKSIDPATGLGVCCQCTNTTPTGCHTGVLRMLDGRTGEEVWSLDKASAASNGFAGLSVAIGDVDHDGRMDIIAVTGEGYVVLVDSTGKVLRTSDTPIPGADGAGFGWGGGLSLADMDGDGFPEIAYGAAVFTTKNGAITHLWTGAAGNGGTLSTFVDLDGMPDNHLELLAGNTAYRIDGSLLWNRVDLPDGFSGVGDFDTDGKPDVVLIAPTGMPAVGNAWILEGATGQTLLGPVQVPGTGSGGPPTVADFDGDGKPEIGVAMATFYSMLKPNFATKTIDVVWQVPNHDLSSSITGSSVFDFEGDGKAEVIYADECFLWVFDGQTGAVRFAAPHTSFTATEAPIVADVDGDGRSEMLMVSNGANPTAGGWKCLDANDVPVTVNGVTWTPSAAPGKAYRGVVAFGDLANSWVGTRTLWNEHTYHVSNVCDDRDTACAAPNVYGSIPKVEKRNWSLLWLNNFRQNVQDKGLFDAPDATVSLAAYCSDPVRLHVAVRNIGLASLVAGVDIAIYKKSQSMDLLVGQVATTHALFPGQTEELTLSVDPTHADKTDSFVARVLVDKMNPKFHECREDNDESQIVKASCLQ